MTSSLLTKKRANDLDGKEWLRNSISTHISHINPAGRAVFSNKTT